MASRVFKKRPSYQSWNEMQDEGEQCTNLIQVECTVNETATRFLLGEDFTDGTCRTYSYGATLDEQVLADCFYLGSYDMTGRSVTGRGCINEPAAMIWKQTQMETTGSTKKMRRKNSLPSSTLHACRPKYVRLVACPDDLKVVDNYTEEILVSFSYRWISFTGTHPKYNRMFCFIAWEPKNRTPYCHAFKCEDACSARTSALDLSDVFKRKCEEILGKGEAELSAIRPVFNKSISLHSCQQYNCN
jgi:hypothetical protein